MLTYKHYDIKKGLTRTKTRLAVAFSGGALILGGGAMSLASFATAHAASSTVTVTGNTAAAENQPGWMFNRDLSTSTPYEFNTDQHSIGSGSLYVKPIGTNPSDKFIAENFLNAPIANVPGISYDFRIGSGGSATQAGQFYMNVYANFGVSADDKFYDCRYDVVPTVGSTSAFTTVSFDPTQAYPVTTRGGVNASPFTCPAVPADMNLSSPDSNIRAFALNVGDTSTSDVGLDGYLDKVVVATGSDTTTYDFEAIASPTITYPANGSTRTVAQMDKVDWTDVNGATTYQYRAFSDPAYTVPVYDSLPTLTTSEIPTPGTPPGEYYVQVRALNTTSTSAWSNNATNPYHFTVVATVSLANKDACKNNGWKTSNTPVFKNQGDCVSYFATGGRNPANG
jgi:hypothetical protein